MEVNKVFHILEEKKVIYTYEIYAVSKKEALEKYNNHGDYREIGLDSGSGKIKNEIIDMGYALDKCAVCGLTYSPKNISVYKCDKCKKM